MTEQLNTCLKHRNISIACKYLSGLVGGAERNIVDLANLLSSVGANVKIFVMENNVGVPAFPLGANVEIVNTLQQTHNSASMSAEDALNEEVKRAPWEGHREALDWYDATFGMRLRWERALRAHDPDLVITFLPHTSTYVLEQLRNEIPVLVTNQNSPSQDYFNPDRHDPSVFDRDRRLNNLKYAAAIQVLVPPFVDELPRHLRDKIAVIPNSVPTHKYTADLECKVISAMGRLVPQKGFDLLVRAMEHVSREEPEWQLRLFGRGPEHDNLMRQIRTASLQRHVLLMGRTGRPLQDLASSSIFVIPSEYEGWGLTLTEAMSVGLPCIGFGDCSGVNWLLRNPAHGRLVPVREPEQLSQHLVSLIRSPESRHLMGAAARESVSEFQPDNVNRRWLALCSRLIRKPGVEMQPALGAAEQ